MKLFYNFREFAKRAMLFLFATLLAATALAQGQAQIPYAVFDAATSTFYFKYGVPQGTANVNYYPVNYTGDIPGWISIDQFNPTTIQKNTKRVVFESGFSVARPKQCKMWFFNFRQLTSIDGMAYLNTSECVTLERMFHICQSLKRVDVSRFNTKKVKNMSQMFCNCNSLTSVTFGANFSTQLVSAGTYTCINMFANCVKLRFIDFYQSNHLNAITNANRKDIFASMETNQTKVVFLPHGSQNVTDQTNFVYSYGGNQTDLRCPRYYSEDKVDIEFPRNFRTNEAVYTRTVSNPKGTVILPYAFNSNSNVQAYTLQKEYNNFMWFESTQTVPAHIPFVFRNLTGSTTANFTQTDTSRNFGITVYATRDTELHGSGPYTANANLSGWTMKGYYVNQTIDSYSNLYYVQNGHFTRANGEKLQFAPHRVTFHGSWAVSPSGSPAGAPSYEIRLIDKGTTAIESIETDNTSAETEAIFDTSGRRLADLKKGVNIIRLKNGTTKKVIIK